MAVARPILPKCGAPFAASALPQLTSLPRRSVGFTPVYNHIGSDQDAGLPPSWRALTVQRREQCQAFRARLMSQGWSCSELNYPDVVRRLKSAPRLAYRLRIRKLVAEERQKGTPMRFLAEVLCTQSRVLSTLPSETAEETVLTPQVDETRTPGASETSAPPSTGAVYDEEVAEDRRMLEEWLASVV